MNVKISNNTQPEDPNPFSSFFDDPKPSEKLWRKPLKHEENLDPQRIIIKTYLNKKNKKGNTFQKRYYQFSTDNFFIKQLNKRNKIIFFKQIMV